MKNIGFIGTGVMGAAMAKNLMKAGYGLTVYNRTRSKAGELLANGAKWAESPAKCAEGSEAVVTIVGYPADVEEVYLGKEGVLAGASPGMYAIDMTTTSPALSERIYAAARAVGVSALDAPVSGGDTGARAGTLSIMVGGDREAFDACRELLAAMGKTIVYEGGPGKGQHTKMANQIAIAGAIAGVCEALAYGKAAGLDLQTMLDSISMGAAGSFQLSNMAPRMLKGDFAPGFFLKHFIKDMNISREEAAARGLELEVLASVLNMYSGLERRGLGDEGTQALIKHYVEKL